MDEKQLEELKAEGQFAINDPEAYVLSNPTPHDWTLSAQEIAQSVKINPLQFGFTKEEIEGPKKLSMVGTAAKGIWGGIAQGVDDFDSMMNVRDVEYSSPHMTEPEATRLMQDALYTRHKGREAEQELTAQKIKYNTLYDISNAVGSLIKYAGLGFLTGSPAAVGVAAGLESIASMEADMVDRYVDQTGGIEGYDKKRRDKDLGIAGSYGVFTGITESMLGIDRIAAGALGRYSTIDAASRLARIQGKLTKSALLQAGKRFGLTALEEGAEEFIQSVGEDVANYIAGYEDAVFTDENFKKAITSAAYGAMLGGPAGWFVYRYNRKSIIDKINKMSQERNWGLTDQQIAQATDQILEESKTTMVDEIATRAEIKNHYGQAYELVKQRITEQIDATGTTPWTDQNKSKEEYITVLADSITIPAVNMANVLNIPLSEFLEIADINTATIAGNVAWLQPITNVEDIDKIIADQDAVIKQEREAKKLGVDDDTKLKRARTRKAIAERVRKEIIGEQALRTIRQNRKKETADYVTAQDLQPEQVKTLENAVQATGDQDYVLFGGIRIPVDYQVVELATIQPSHIDGTPNPAYTNAELQNRASRGTVEDVADLRQKATNITPERLMRASTSAEGAPVVNAKGEVIAGNGREEIIRYAYENPETAEKYKQELVKQGFDIEGIQKPILVRRNTTMTDQEQVAAADISNISETSAFDNASQARRDTQYLKDSKTPIEFASKLPMSERRGLMQNNGKWNKRKVQQRYEDALLAWLCGNDTQLFENLVLDRGLSQKVINILADNGTLIYETATKYPGTELREDIYHALVKMQRATRDNFLETTQQLELDGHDVMPENIIIWNWLFTDTTTNDQFLQSYATTLANNHESVNAGEDMFGQKVAPLSKKDALIQALKKADQAKAETMAARGRDYLPLFDENGMATDVNLAAAIASYNNQFAPVNTDNQLSQEVLQQFDLADENARLDNIYPEYTGETIEVDGKEHTVYNSEGKRIAKSAEALTNFWRWFGDSKVVDEQGRPLVMYHGTENIFDTFDKRKISSNTGNFGMYGKGFYFSDMESTAKYYANFHGKSGIVMPVYLRIEKPLYESDYKKDPEYIKAREKDGKDDLGRMKNTAKYIEKISKQNGNDGVISINSEYVVFDNKQIKSIDNRGTFSPYDNNIYYQAAYTSGSTYYDRPSTEYVLRGGEGQIVHGWGLYFLADKDINRRRYREDQFAGKFVYVPQMPKITRQKGIKTDNGTELPKIAPDLTDEQNVVLDQTLITLTAQNIARNIANGRGGYKSIAYPLNVLLSHIYQTQKPNPELKNQLYTTRWILDEIYSKIYVSPDGKKLQSIENKPIPKLATRANASLFFIKDAIDDAKSVFHVKTSEITPEQLEMVLNEFLQDPEYMRKNIFTNDFLSQIVPNQTDEFYTELSNKLTDAINGIDPLTENFDNSIFKESGAQVIDFKESNTAQVIVEKIKDTLDGGYRETYVDEIIKSDRQTYGGYLGLMVLAKYTAFRPIVDLFSKINNGVTTFDNIETDEDYKYIKSKTAYDVDEKFKTAHLMSAYDVFRPIIESAKDIYNSTEFKNESADKRTWMALSQAIRNMPQDQQDKLSLYLFTTYNMKENNIPTFIGIIQHPENIKKTRGQQLEVDLPENDVLLNEETFLADQPSAPLLRKVLEDFAPGGLLYDYVNRTNEHNFKAYREKHNIPEQNLKDFHERLLENIMSGLIDGYTTEEIGRNKEVKLLIDYIMENLKGDDFYIATMEAIQDTSIDLQSGETIGEEKDYSAFPKKNVMGIQVSSELARDASLYLNDMGIKGVTYRGGIDKTGFVIFSDEVIQTLRRLDDDLPMYYQKRGRVRGTYDPELQAIILTKYWNETTLVHEYHHRFLEKLWGYFKQAQTGERAVSDEFLADMDKLFQMLEIDPAQDQLTVVQQEKFATMVEAYLTGLGVDNPENLAFQSFLHWIPEQYKSIMDLGYLDENNEIQNPILDQESIDWFNKWFACPFAPSLASAPDAQRIVNPTDKTGQIVPSSQKIMNNREKEWGQDSEEQNKADAQLWRAINENTPNDMRAALDGEKVSMKAATDNLPDDTKLPEPHKPTIREKWFKTYQPDARERAADMAREYLAQNPDHARELAFADPETSTEFDAPVDRGMLIRAVMETVPHGSNEWYILNDNLATVKSMSGSTLSLSGDLSHQAYLDAKREVEAARELKAAVNYAGTRRGAMDKWNSDIKAFIAQRTEALLATEPDSEERKTAIKAFLEEAKTKFSANTTDAVLNQMDLTGIKTKNSQVFVKWAEKQIKQAAHAKIDATEQKELIKASIAAQLALKEIDSTTQKDGKYTRAVQSAKDIRHWQFVKDKMKKAYIGRWGKFGIFWDNLFGSYAPSAMLMSANTLFFANVPSTAINTLTIRQAAKTIGKNNVDETTQKGEIERIRQVFNASGVNLAQMDKPTSPSTLHGEKYTKSEQSHWYDFTFEILGRTDNVFRIPTFVDALARIATKDAGGDKTKATVLFKEYAKLNNQSDEAKIARKQALAVANMAVFTQDGTLATGLNQIRTVLNTISRVPLGLEPQGFGLGNILAPFLKTGANITEMGFDAMLAPIRTMAAGFQKLQGKEIPDIKKLALTSDWINLAWTSVMIALMAAISGDDDEWYTEPYTSGRRYDPNKPYDSIRFGNTWVKMDIFGPIAIPLRTAAMAIKEWEDKKLESIGDGIFEALSETPLVQQFTDSSLDYMSKQPGKYWSSFGYNQANKLVPAQAKSVIKATSRATDAQLDTNWMGKTIDRKFHRNYGLDGERLTTNDLINILTNRLKYSEQ